jgi:hypothetical protein
MHEQWPRAQGCFFRRAPEQHQQNETPDSRKHASSTETEECEAREGLAPLYQPGCSNRDAFVGYVTGRTAARISQMLAIHHRRWPFIRFVIPTDTGCVIRAALRQNLAGAHERRFQENNR